MPRISPNPEAVKKLLAELWEKNLPVLRERLLELDAATEAARAGAVSAGVAEAAANTAHKLAGSLGMFGYPHGTELARRLEVMFGAESLEPEQLRGLLRELRDDLGLG